MKRWIQPVKHAYDRVDHWYKLGYNRIFFSCEQMMELTSRSMEWKLTPRERITRKIHLFVCTWCRRYEQQLHFLRRNVSTYAERFPTDGADKLSPEARDRVRQRLREGSTDQG